jgi:hypothetical protein
MSVKNKINGLLACLNFDNPFQLILSRLIFRKSRFVAHRVNGVQFVADQQGGDECGLRPCLIEGMYDPFIKATGILKSTSPLKVVDIGANAGGFSLIFSVLKIRVEKIVAVEMNPLTYSRMRLNLLTNFGPQAIPINAAIGGYSMNLNVPFTFGGTGDSVNFSKQACKSSFIVPMRTVDDLLNSEFEGQKIDLLKMDIEGSEWDILEFGTCQRLRDCRYLLIELHPNARFGVADFQIAIQRYGFSLVDIHNSNAENVFLFSQNSSHASE